MTRRSRGLVAAAISVPVLAVGALAAARLGVPGPAAVTAPHFVEEAIEAGVEHRYDGDFDYFVGGGVAVFDCNDDGRPDLYIAGGSEPAELFVNRSDVGGSLAFDPLASAVTDQSAVVGAYPIDIDGDGTVDLAVLRRGESLLLRGLGDCTFERANEAWGFDGGDAWTTAFSATWESADGFPTLAFGRYLEPDSVADGTYLCDDNQLVRPGASGAAYGAPIALSPSYCTLSLLFSDWDRSGRRDLRASNDRHYYRNGEEQLWRIDPGERPRLWTREEGWQSVQIWGMGIASYDLTGDGYPEIYLTSQASNRLQTLEDGPGEPRYEDIARQRGVTAHEPYTGDVSLRSTAWHPEFQDVNNDGLIDLFVSKGNVEAVADYAARDPNNLLIGQPDGTFVEGGMDAGIVSFARARGAALADLNLDGLLDLVVVNRRVNVGLWRNVGAGTASAPEPMGNWVTLRLEQPGANRDAIGAWVEVDLGTTVLRREVTVGGGHAGGQLGWIHFGLGAADDADVTVTWPDGSRSQPMTVRANSLGVVERGATEIQPWTAPAE